MKKFNINIKYSKIYIVEIESDSFLDAKEFALEFAANGGISSESYEYVIVSDKELEDLRGK